MADVIKILKSVGAVMTDDHFVYTSGKHGSIYVNKDALYPYVEETSEVCRMMAEQCAELDIDTVAAPALGGIILSQWVGYHLTQLKQKPVKAVYAEKDGNGGFKFTRGYDQYITNKKVLVLEDLTTTGGSVKTVVDSVRSYDGQVVGVCVMVNRNPQEVNSELFDAPFFALGELEAEAYEEAKMPAELRQRPVNTQLGHGAEYLAHKKEKNE
jgi:orotate phosphoribosyltransferase